MKENYIYLGASVLARAVTDNPIFHFVPTALNSFINICPGTRSLWINKKCTDQELEKFEKLKSIIQTVAMDLGINRPKGFAFQISKSLNDNACVYGTSSSMGGPFIVLGDSFFQNFDAINDMALSDYVNTFSNIPEEQKSDFKEWIQWIDSCPNNPEKMKEFLCSFPDLQRKRFNELSMKFNGAISKDALLSSREVLSIFTKRLYHNDYVEWLKVLEEIPNTAEELAEYLDSCSDEKRLHIKELVSKFQGVLTNEEIESLFAHELGHAKNHHQLKAAGTVLIALKIYDAMQYLIKYAAFNSPQNVYKLLRSFSGVLPLAILPAAYVAFIALSRQYEREADNECTGKYQKGFLTFHKKDLISELLEDPKTSAAVKLRAMMHQTDFWSTHPNPAKRLSHAATLGNTNLIRRSMSVSAKALAIIGAVSMAHEIFAGSSNIYNWLAG